MDFENGSIVVMMTHWWPEATQPPPTYLYDDYDSPKNDQVDTVSDRKTTKTKAKR